MPGSSSWMPHAPQGVKGFDDDDIITPVGGRPLRTGQPPTGVTIPDVCCTIQF